MPPVKVGRRVTITDVYCALWHADGFGLAVTGATDNQIVAAQIQVLKPVKTQHRQELAQLAKGPVLQIAGDGFTFQFDLPFLTAIGGVDRRVREHAVQFQHHALGAATHHPVVDDGYFWLWYGRVGPKVAGAWLGHGIHCI